MDDEHEEPASSLFRQATLVLDRARQRLALVVTKVL